MSGAYGLSVTVGNFVRRSVRMLMLQVIHDELLHAEVVGAGPFRFRECFGKDMGPFFLKNRIGCDHLADVTFRFFEVQWRQRHPDMTPTQWLDKVKINAPPTPDEIEDAWEVEIGSSDSAMRQFYEGSARHRKGRDLGSRTTPGRPS